MKNEDRKEHVHGPKRALKPDLDACRASLRTGIHDLSSRSMRNELMANYGPYLMEIYEWRM